MSDETKLQCGPSRRLLQPVQANQGKKNDVDRLYPCPNFICHLWLTRWDLTGVAAAHIAACPDDLIRRRSDWAVPLPSWGRIRLFTARMLFRACPPA